MKVVLKLTLILAIVATAAIGCLIIFEFVPLEQGQIYLIKALSAIFLLGFSSLLIAMIAGKKKKPEEPVKK